MDSDYTYDDTDITKVKRWGDMQTLIDVLAVSGMVLEVDTAAWSGIHLAPGDAAYIQPVIKISHPENNES